MDEFFLMFPSSTSVGENLGREQRLLEILGPKQGLFMVYRNRESVILGRNQNPWWELDRARLGRMGIPLYRRISGGGTVYHDLGNLNYCFILPRPEFDKAVDLGILGDFFLGLLPDCSISPRGDLLCSGKKFSGNALAYRRHHVLHHGTLLYSTNLPRLNHSLQPPAWRTCFVTQPASPSNPMETTDLSHLLPFGDIKAFGAALVDHVGSQGGFGGKTTWLGESEFPGLARTTEAGQYLDFGAEEWVLGQTPEFGIQLPGQVPERISHGVLPLTGGGSVYLPMTWEEACRLRENSGVQG